MEEKDKNHTSSLNHPVRGKPAEETKLRGSSSKEATFSGEEKEKAEPSTSSTDESDNLTNVDRENSTEGTEAIGGNISAATGSQSKTKEATKSELQGAHKPISSADASAAGIEPSTAKASSKSGQLLLTYFKLLRRFDKLQAKQRKGRTCKGCLTSDENFLRQEYVLEELRRKLLELSVRGTLSDTPPTSEEEDEGEEGGQGYDDKEQAQLLLFAFDSLNFPTVSYDTFELGASASSMPPSNSVNLQVPAKPAEPAEMKNKIESAESSTQTEVKHPSKGTPIKQEKGRNEHDNKDDAFGVEEACVGSAIKKNNK